MSPGSLTTRPRTGTVRAFDEQRGLGNVAGDDGAEFLFHCTAITDGTRRIEVGTRVVFDLVPGHGGRVEAGSVTPIA